MRKRVLSNRLRFESLESRFMPAGNVVASLVGDLLLLRGDAAANNIALTAGAVNQQVVVTGVGTKVNGATAARTFNNVRAVQVLLNDGNDILSFDNGATAFLRSFTADGGRGNDSIAVDNVRAGTIAIADSLGGDDTVDVGAAAAVVIRQGMTIATNGGDDWIRVLNATIGGSLAIDAGTAPVWDSVFVADSRIAGNAAIATCGGDDVVRLQTTDVGGVLSIATGGNSAMGGDFIGLSDMTVTTGITIDAGAGNDLLNVTFVRTLNLIFDLGAGDDTIGVLAVNAPPGPAPGARGRLNVGAATPGNTQNQGCLLIAIGGAGYDTLVGPNQLYFQFKTLCSFERLSDPVPQP